MISLATLWAKPLLTCRRTRFSCCGGVAVLLCQLLLPQAKRCKRLLANGDSDTAGLRFVLHVRLTGGHPPSNGILPLCSSRAQCRQTAADNGPHAVMSCC